MGLHSLIASCAGRGPRSPSGFSVSSFSRAAHAKRRPKLPAKGKQRAGSRACAARDVRSRNFLLHTDLSDREANALPARVRSTARRRKRPMRSSG